MSADAGDACLAAIVALVNAAPGPMAVFDATGGCVAANRNFILNAARDKHPGAAPHAVPAWERRAPFSPDGARTWTLVTAPEAASSRPALEFVDAVVNALPIMFNAKDSESRYLYMNRYQAELYGVTPAEAVGRTAGDLLGEAHGKYTRGLDAEVLRSGRAMAFFEETYACADQVPRHWLTSKVPLLGEGGTVWGVATVAIDISERKLLEEQLREARDEAEAGSRAKSRFLAAMSHELRTPLNAVIGFAELMEEEALGPLGHGEYVEYAGHILRSGMHLLQMITNLLDYARVESGTLELNVVDIEMVRLVRSVVAGARSEPRIARDPPVTLSVDVPKTMIPIRGDEARLRQVLGGLVSNALKFTPPGGRVSVTVEPLDGGAEVVIADTGIGMAPEELEHVFEPFWQADSGLGRQRDGVGIGLGLARELIALHGGALALESRKGEGTTATVRLAHAPPARSETPAPG